MFERDVFFPVKSFLKKRPGLKPRVAGFGQYPIGQHRLLNRARRCRAPAQMLNVGGLLGCVAAIVNDIESAWSIALKRGFNGEGAVVSSSRQQRRSP
jgi:hypothetical protein